MKAKPKKCHLAIRETTYLGHLVGGGEVKAESNKVEAVREFPRPVTKKDVRSFLGLTGYYHKFIPSYASIAAPLSDLTKKCRPQVVNWRPECEEAFYCLKESLCVPPVLASPNLNQPFIIQTDASERGIGSMLSQLGGDQQEHPVMFLSRKLLPREKNYATVEKECLAVVWAIQSLQVYLCGQEFTIQSDNHALQWLDRMKDKNPRLTRWSLTLPS